MENKNLQSALNELKRITGVSFHIDIDSSEEDSHTLEQLKALIAAYKEKNNRETILKKWITGSIETHELYHTAKRFHIPLTSARSLFLIESQEDFDDSVFTILKHAFPDNIQVWMIPMSLRQIVIVYTFSDEDAEKELLPTAFLIMDILNTEALIQVKISFSSIIHHLNELPSAYQETVLALNVGKIFYVDQNIYPYNQLGLGRLIYSLSPEQCTAYLREVLGTDSTSFFPPDMVHTITCFLNNNLNIAETTRQLHIHRNTLIYRIEQIEKETGLDIRQFHDAMTIKTVLLILNYLQHLSS